MKKFNIILEGIYSDSVSGTIEASTEYRALQKYRKNRIKFGWIEKLPKDNKHHLMSSFCGCYRAEEI